MHRQSLLKLLQDYRTSYMEESSFRERAMDFIQQHEDCFYRELWPAHVTGSSWVVNPARTHVLMLHHKKHEQWFQPGGHADGQSDILAVALRETHEETGLDSSCIRLLNELIFDIDIHAIPAMHNEPSHEHIDIRFLVEIDDSLAIPGNDESHQVMWVPLHRVSIYNNNLSTYRMVEKTRRLRSFI